MTPDSGNAAGVGSSAKQDLKLKDFSLSLPSMSPQLIPCSFVTVSLQVE